MSGRPDTLLPYFRSPSYFGGIGPKVEQKFAQLGITAAIDAALHVPSDLIHRPFVESFDTISDGQVISFVGEVMDHQPPQGRRRTYRIMMMQGNVPLVVVFFRAQRDYLTSRFPIGGGVAVSGKVERYGDQVQMTHPDFILPAQKADEIPQNQRVYPATQGLHQRQIAALIDQVLGAVPPMPEWIDPHLKKERGWPDWFGALTMIHAPDRLADLAPEAPAKARLSYDELFSHQLTLALARQNSKERAGRINTLNSDLMAAYLRGLPFEPTSAQTRAIEDITQDLQSPKKMSRLLQGDVGSGKTVVAFAAMFAALGEDGQAALMAPTEILARQHFANLLPHAAALGVEVALLTAREKGAKRRQLLAELQSGQCRIVVGTHALFQDKVHFSNLRFAVIDEQHRFGVSQRSQLGQKGAQVDQLVMTATPIPRSLALAQYGDLDISILDEKPAGRMPIATSVISTEQLDPLLTRIEENLKRGVQIYWVCPLVEESEVLEHQAATERYNALVRRFNPDQVALIHGQMPSEEKDSAMARFQSGHAQILVATTVIEVGVDVPKATIMVIENAEKFGLSQLHQLRGRVGRGTEQSFCVLLYQSPLTQTGQKRLEILRDSNDGFEIAQKDLELRGTGDILGTAQSGVPRFKIADIASQSKLLAIAHKDARALLQKDPDLSSERGQAARLLLWLMRRDTSFNLLKIG